MHQQWWFDSSMAAVFALSNRRGWFRGWHGWVGQESSGFDHPCADRHVSGCCHPPWRPKQDHLLRVLVQMVCAIVKTNVWIFSYKNTRNIYCSLCINHAKNHILHYQNLRHRGCPVLRRVLVKACCKLLASGRQAADVHDRVAKPIFLFLNQTCQSRLVLWHCEST